MLKRLSEAVESLSDFNFYTIKATTTKVCLQGEHSVKLSKHLTECGYACKIDMNGYLVFTLNNTEITLT